MVCRGNLKTRFIQSSQVEAGENLMVERYLIDSKVYEFVKSQKVGSSLTPAKAGILLFQNVLSPGFRQGDDPRDFLRDPQDWRE